MADRFFKQPILNSPYEYPTRHWELDSSGQPTQLFVENRRRAEFITPIPEPRKRRRKTETQQAISFDEVQGLSTKEQKYDPTSVINKVRSFVHAWRNLPSANDWQVTRETARLLQHWRLHRLQRGRGDESDAQGTAQLARLALR